MTPPDELKFAVRQLLKNPGFSAVAALTLALGPGPGDSCGAQSRIPGDAFLGRKAGDETTVGGVRLCWCPAGKFMMGSPRSEPHPKLPGGIDPDLYLAEASSRVRRGGCWADEGWPCRSAFRLRFEPERRYDHIGFRVVLVKP